jgi:hypothetical protein
MADLTVQQLRERLQALESAGYGALGLTLSLNDFESSSITDCVVVQEDGHRYVELGDIVRGATRVE